MLTSAPSSSIRSPLFKPSGLRPGAVLVSLLRSVAFGFNLRRPAEASRRSPLSRREEITLRGLRLAGLALAQLRTVIQACRPVAPPFHPDGALVVQIPRTVLTISAAYPPVGAQGPCLLFEMHSNTEEVPSCATGISKLRNREVAR